MSLRRLKPFPVATTTNTISGSIFGSRRFQSTGTGDSSSSSKNPKSGDVDIEAELASAERASFSKIRDSLLSGSESASIYSSPTPGSQTGFEDPAQANSRFTRLFIESVVDTDALGGQHRGDYYRDPSAGYSPQHAPRNYGAGGVADAYHPLSSLEYETSYNQRSAEGDHFIQQSSSAGARTRAALLRRAQHGGGLQAHPNRFGAETSEGLGGDGDSMSSPNFRPSANMAVNAGEQIYSATTAGTESADPNISGFFEQAASPRIPKNAVGSWQNTATSGQQQQSSSRLAWLDAQSQLDHDTASTIAGNRDAELELFRRVHGERDRERQEEGRFENFVQNNKIGYDVDKMNARANNKLPFRGVSNLIPPGSASEIQSDLRRDNISPEHASYQEQAAANTTAAAPLQGEALTRHLVETAESRRRTAEREMVDDWHQQTGRGRKNPLVSDSGPDQRSQQLGKNDERLLRAAQFDQRAYVKTDSEMKTNPYAKRSTSGGVAHLLDSEFDRRRRADLLAQGQQDPIERTHMHLGQPMKEQVDERVRYRSNNRPQRPLEYFLPFPKQTDMLQLQAYSDVEGFPLFSGKMANVRLNPFEWDLFIRYRAHAAQRRDIALKNGLEPRPNESVAERKARREALDELCEKTPFDPSFVKLDAGVSLAPAAELRQWFGAYWLPSPTLSSVMLGKTMDAGLHLIDEKRPGFAGDSKAPLDEREHVLSGRYLSKLLTIDTFNSRLQRQTIKEQYLGRAPEPEIIYRVSGATLKHFTPEQKEAYEEYIKRESEKHVQQWNGILSGRRFVPNSNSYGRSMKSYVNDVINIRAVHSGEEVVASAQLVQEELTKAISKNNNNNDNSSTKNNTIIKLEGNEYIVQTESVRAESFVDIKLENGSVISMVQSEWNALPEEHSPTGVDGSLDANNHLNVGMPENFSYNRLNYIETQDVLWENRVASGEEGWTSAIHPDGLKEGLPVRARRTFNAGASSSSQALSAPRYGDFERAVIRNYNDKPFYNPEPREVSVVFHNEPNPVTVPLSNVSIWQVQWSGQERTQPLQTYKLNGGMRRFVNMQDPKGEKDKFNSTSHFLDKYLTSKQQTELSQKWRYSKSIADIDNFTRFDINRSHNHRLISGSNVKQYIRSGFFHRYTPWEFILSQEADAPIIADQLRPNNSEGTSFFFSPNRFWRYKRRPYGYIKNHPNEVRDLFQYIDGSVGWDKAKQIRTHWEVREHHPIPAFHRPGNVHRNQAKILPAHLWESDKKTGKVKVLKDSLKDYKPLHVYPKWTNL